MTNRASAFEPLLARWMSELARAGRTATTIAAYRLDLDAIGCDLKKVLGLATCVESLAKVGQPEIDELDRAWTEMGLARSTSLRRFSTLRGFAAAASKTVDCGGILAAALPVASRREMHAASEEDVDQLLGFSVETWSDARDSAILNVMAETGATSIEVVALDCRHQWTDADSLALAAGSPIARVVTISSTAVGALTAYRGSAPFQFSAVSPLFRGSRGQRLEPRTIQVMMAKRSAQAGVSVSITSMMLRHRRGRQLVADGRSPQQVAEALGISVATAAKYFAPPHDDLRVRKLQGRRGRSARLRRTALPCGGAADLRPHGGSSCL
ncbi:site-specific integrase [Bradyrhizobium embrapense]